jgi:folate-binding protein YgfZ
MRDNQQIAPQPRFALPGLRFITLEGRDAQVFAHAQFMNDVKSLRRGAWQWNGWLTPKGRVIALFALLKLDDERLGLLLLDADPEAFVASLRRFVFRSKLVIEIRDDLHAVGSFSVPSQASGDAIAGDSSSGYELDLGGDGGQRALRIAGNDDGMADPESSARWTAFDLEHGLPRLSPSQAEQWTPQMLSLDRLHAFSVKKGCYPGQEIVARTHFLGQAKRGLVLFDAAAPVAVGGDVRDGERNLGTVISAEGQLALAVLPLDRGSDALRVGDATLRERPLLGGLVR